MVLYTYDLEKLDFTFTPPPKRPHTIYAAYILKEGNETMAETMTNLEIEQAARIASLEKTIELNREHVGFDMAEIRGQHRNVLVELIRPLLEDAIDAIEIDPPELGIAVRRIQAALRYTPAA